MINIVTINIISMFKDLYVCLKKLHNNVMLEKKIKKPQFVSGVCTIFLLHGANVQYNNKPQYNCT